MAIDDGGPTPAELGVSTGEQSKGNAPAKEPPQDIVTKLMPKVEQVFNKDRTVDEAKMLRLMDELEKTGEIKDNIHTLGEGKDRAVILRSPVERTTERTSYGEAVRPRELIPMGTMTTNTSEWLGMNRKGFQKYVVVDEQTLTLDRNSAYFDSRRFPDSHYFDYSGPVKADQHWMDQIRRWADQVQGYVKYTFGEKNREMVNRLLRSRDYPPAPAKDPRGTGAPREEVLKFYDEADLHWFGNEFNPNSGWSNLNRTEGERRASASLRPYDNPAGFEMVQWQSSFYKVDSPKFVQEALNTNVKQAPQN